MTTITRRHVLTVGPLALSGLLVACGSQPSSGGSSTTPTAGAAVSGEASDAPPSSTTAASASGSATASQATQTLSPQEEATAAALSWISGTSSQDYSGESDLIITAVRAGQHEDFDRVVVQFSGTGTPGWEAVWVQEAYTQGKGDPISVEGENMLLLRGTGVTMPVMPEQQQAEYQGPAELNVYGTAIGTAYLDPTFEGQFQLVIGTHSQDYRVFALTEPTRLVVDVARPQAMG